MEIVKIKKKLKFVRYICDYLLKNSWEENACVVKFEMKLLVQMTHISIYRLCGEVGGYRLVHEWYLIKVLFYFLLLISTVSFKWSSDC